MEEIDAQVLMRKGMRGCASYIQTQCSLSSDATQLNLLLSSLLSPLKPIDDTDNITWIKWIIAGGKIPSEFAKTVQKYDTATTCGLVWTANFVAYRCRTCGISPCMSLCSDCFQRGDHAGHDFNMFRSQAGGACDCGDASVMKESGFCERHRPKPHLKKKTPPRELLCIAEIAMPRLYLRLLQHLRQHSEIASSDDPLIPVSKADTLVTLLHEYSSYGAAMRQVMTSTICNAQIYAELTEVPIGEELNERLIFMKQADQLYKKAVQGLPGPEPPEEYREFPALSDKIYHRTFLEEFVFWTVKYEFPQKIVCWLLNMLPDPKYKEELTKAFVLHYGRISKMLNKTADSDTLSNRVVHVSVQLFSNEELAFKMVDTMHLLQVMAVSLRDMAIQVLTPCLLHHTEKNTHMVVDCSNHTMKDHCYWPIVSDMNNVLSHKNIALRFMQDETLLKMWFSFLAMFQGMNVNVREVGNHVEFEPNTYYAAFSGELEASASAMWALALHLKNEETLSHTRRLLDYCLAAVKIWFETVGFTDPDNMDPYQLTFHIPLHRNIAAFMCQALKYQGARMTDVVPDPRFMHLLMMHPLRVQVGFYEILAGMWVRNGLQIKGQAMTYLQCHFGNSMVDADIYLLQLCATQVKPSIFLMTVIEKFHVLECMSLSPNSRYALLEPDQEVFMIESCLTFLASLMSIRTYIGDNDAEVFSLEVLSILCMGDKTHSQLMELLPEKCGSPQTKDIDAALTDVADYRAPNFEASGTLQQGMYVPKAEVWENLYDPIYVLLRAVHRRDFQSSMDRFTEYVYQSNRFRGKTLWPPFRPPSAVHPSHTDPRVILTSSTFVAFSFVILQKFLANNNAISEQTLSLCIYLLDMAVTFFSAKQLSGQELMVTGDEEVDEIIDMKFSDWFHSDYLPDNLCKVVDKITPQEITAVSFQSSDGGEMYEESSDADMDVSEITSEVADQSAGSSALPHSSMLALEGQSTALVQAGTIHVSHSSSSISRRAILAGNELVPLSGSSGMAMMRSPGHSQQHGDYGTVNNPALPIGNEVVLSETTSLGSYGGSRHKALPPNVGTSRSEGTSSMGPAICEGSQTEKIEIGESAVSLLLKIHSKLSGGNHSYLTPPERTSSVGGSAAKESLIGDGPFFVGKLLDKIWNLDDQCRNCINEVRRNIWPRTQEMIDQESREKEAREKEERKRKAKERQQKLMAEFATKQQQFMQQQQAMEAEPVSDHVRAGDTVMVQRREEYDCVICNQTSPSTYERPMSLVILIQSTSTVGHRRCPSQTADPNGPHSWSLPLRDEDKDLLRNTTTLAMEAEKRIDLLRRHFDEESWLLSINNGWEGGVFVQTCGHHLHLDCHKSYVQSLKTSQRHQSMTVDKGEYSCPLCRQLSNAALPLAPELGDVMTLVASQTVAPSVLAKMIHNFLIDEPPIPSQLSEAMARAMEGITNSTYVQYRHASTSSSPASFFLFVNSVARMALEVELVMRGDSLTGPPISKFQAMMVPKNRKSCFVPLVHVLAMHSKILRTQQHNAMWSQVTGVPSESRSTTLLPSPENQVPILLRDPVALLLQLLLVLPLHMDRAYLTCIMSAFYNLTFFQALAQLVLGLTKAKRETIKQSSPDTDENWTLLNSVQIVIHFMEKTGLLTTEDETSDAAPSISDVLYEVELGAQKMCLTYLRNVSLLMHHFYGEPLPQGTSRSETEECILLLKYLGLIKVSGPVVTSPGETLMEMDKPGASTSTSPEDGSGSSSAVVNSLQRTKASIITASDETKDSDPVFFVTAEALKWVCELSDSVKTVQTWFTEFSEFSKASPAVARSLLLSYHPWNSPKLMDLPHSYDPLFQYYHKKACSQCNTVPKDPTVCLICGTVVCLRENCCRQQNLHEGIQHSIDCGAGTAVYLAINSSTIVVVRGKRACLWGSVYLDVFGEEDRELKRGKPLYLSKERYEILEQQWLSHRFDHTSKKWILHRDNL